MPIENEPNTPPLDTTPPVETTSPATEPVSEPVTTAPTAPSVSEDDAILAAIRGEEPAKGADDGGQGAAPAEGTPPVDAATPADPAKPDTSVLDEETPKDYKGRTRENFERLRAEGIAHRTKAQELEAQLTALAPNLEREANFTGLLADSGGTPEDIGTAISLIRAVNKGTPEERRNALTVVNALRGIIADQLGEALPDVDYLAGHADLKQRVDDGDLSEADARELAVARRAGKVRSESDTQAAARARQEQETALAQETETSQRQTAAREVEALASQFQRRDGEAYKVRVSYAQQQFARINTHAAVPPAKIPALFRELYESTEAGMLVDASAIRARGVPPSGVRPVMGGGVRGGSGIAQPEAQSEAEAVRMALRGS